MAGEIWRDDKLRKLQYLQDVTLGNIKLQPDCKDNDKHAAKLFAGRFPGQSASTCREIDDVLKTQREGKGICHGYEGVNLSARLASSMCPVTCGMCAPSTPATQVIRKEITAAQGVNSTPVVASLDINRFQNVTGHTGLFTAKQRRLIEQTEPGKRPELVRSLSTAVQDNLRGLAGSCLTPCGAPTDDARWCIMSPLATDHLKTLVPSATMDDRTEMATRPCSANEANETALREKAQMAYDAIANWLHAEENEQSTLPHFLVYRLNLNMHASFALCDCNYLTVEEKVMTAALFNELSNMVCAYSMSIPVALQNVTFIAKWKQVLDRFYRSAAPPKPTPPPPPPKLSLRQKLEAVSQLPSDLKVISMDDYFKQSLNQST